MLFEREQVAARLLDVLQFDFPVEHTVHTLRGYAALSVRLESDTVVTLAGQSHRLTGQNVAYFPPDARYERASRCDRMIVFHFVAEDLPRDFAVFTPRDFAPIAALAEDAYAAAAEKRTGWYYRASACFYELLAALRAAYTEQAPPDAAERAVRYMEQHFKEHTLTVAEVARHVYVSEVHLRTLFHRRVGMAPKAYLTALRIAHARTLLESGFYSVEECAARAGFGDPKNFAVAVRQKTGRTPSELRRP